MELSVIVRNETDEVVFLRDFNFKYSSVDFGPRRIEGRKSVRLGITPIAGREKESFHIVVGDGVTPIELEWRKDKGMEPWVEQKDTPFRILKSHITSTTIQLRIVERKNLMARDDLKQMLQRNTDFEELSEQTGFTKEELFLLQ